MYRDNDLTIVRKEHLKLMLIVSAYWLRCNYSVGSILVFLWNDKFIGVDHDNPVLTDPLGILDIICPPKVPILTYKHEVQRKQIFI